MNKTKINVYKFTETDANIDNSLMMSDAEAVKWLKDKYTDRFCFGIDGLRQNGIYRLMGWAYDFRPFLKKYLYKQDEKWTEVYAPNKTLLRKNTFGRIDQIVSI